MIYLTLPGQMHHLTAFLWWRVTSPLAPSPSKIIENSTVMRNEVVEDGALLTVQKDAHQG